MQWKSGRVESESKSRATQTHFSHRLDWHLAPPEVTLASLFSSQLSVYMLCEIVVDLFDRASD